MKVSSCSCACGNVLIKGQLAPQCLHYYTEKDGQNVYKTFFSLQSQSIDIQEFKDGNKCLYNKTHSNMKCLICGTSFRALSCDNKIYLEKTQPYNHLSKKQLQKCCKNHQLHKNNNVFIVPFSSIIKPLALNEKGDQINSQIDKANQQVCSKFDEDDTDFEIMFSNQYDPFIGSYKHYNESY